ncbi:electron transfer flavoprotein subunit alpha/FixB family protein [Burkholderia humptydooensis]|uniref:Electron transfer flavoprotein subunit alpha/FixB family protein n=3 Tax=Burkholderia humptydooensis TaxID=430531 RepID=A0A7U4SW12_9BURK|nr:MULTISPECIES: electron transfer flavoprotein subunit alpha/FixB family protein [Burkholderia]AJY39982.1 electron transfer flavoFAD-binding domain protein [Burkholderia sp. 2002721687]ALX46202.1 electron transfer flavoprotein subunit alpha [Burkholderia humptydooensis]EIP87244.1 electron transfer flavoprotein, subunit alpha, putative [Burkholderia humptydooensis MSMB43]QPS47709.1 electron transfer flavoprotein subunit alpha/FixB family protein [Burkholderia humptydooensis]
MTTLKRIDPRRPFIVTATGLKRITLGETGGAPGGAAQWALRAHGAAAAKPVRVVREAARVFLVAAHSERGALDDHARQTLAAAALLAGAQTEVALVVFGELNDDAGALGADTLIVLRDFDRRAFAPERELDALRACAAALSPQHVFIPDNATGDGDLGRRYAAAANASVAAHVVEIAADHVGVYVDAKRGFATRALPDVVLLAPNAVDPTLPFVGAALERALDASSAFGARPSASGDYRDLGLEEIDAAQVALEEADFIVSAGNGVTDVAAFETLAAAFGAAVGASRVAVDNGHFTRDKQVGATGKTVDASVYIAFGISGAVQHLQGIKDCRHVIAVNLDGSAPIVKRANLTIVGDAQATIAALIEAVNAARAAQPRAGAVSNEREYMGAAA